MRLSEALIELHKHEINCGLSSFFDSGFDVWIGDNINGISHESRFTAEELDDGTAALWLLHKAELS